MRFEFDVDCAVTFTVHIEGDAKAARRHLADLLRQRRQITFAGADHYLGIGVTYAPHLWPDPDCITEIIPL